MFYLEFTYTEIEMRDKMKKIIPFTKTIKFKTMIAEITDIETKHNLEVKEGNTIEGDIIVDGKYKMHEASQIEEEFHYNLPYTIEVDSKYDISACTITINDFYFEIINEEDLKINIELEIGNVEEKQVALDNEEISLDEESIRKTIEKIPVEIEEKKEKLEVETLETDTMTDLLEMSDCSMPTIPEKNDLEQELEKKLSQEINKNKQLYDDQEEIELVPKSVPSEPTNPIKREENPQEITKMSSIFNMIAQETNETFVTYHVYIVRESDTVDSIIEKYKTTRDDLAAYNDLENIKIGSKVIIPCHHE